MRRIVRGAVLAGVAIALVLGAAEARRRQGLYWYPVDRDYAYDFDPRRAVIVPARIENETVHLPGPDGQRRPALLRLRLSPRLAGWWFEPCIELVAGADVAEQCFERGARGIRYVVLPWAGPSPPRTIALRARHADLDLQDTGIVLLEAPDLAGKRLLVLAPHPDDAEIAAFGLYSTHESYVVTLTAGGYADSLYADVAFRSDVRTWDSVAVPLWGGVPTSRTVNLGYPTNSLQELHAAALANRAAPAPPLPDPGRYRRGAVEALLGGRPSDATWSSVVTDLATVLRTVRPDVVVAPLPELDSAPDHKYTTVALLEALAQVNDATATLLLYTNHHVYSEHYPFGPAGSTVTLPPWFGGARFPSVYSHPLDSVTQTRKLFALGAMHDLRAQPERVTSGPGGVLVQRVRQAADLVARDPFGDYSYFRRAVRPNELFFVYWPEDRVLLGEPPARFNP